MVNIEPFTSITLCMVGLYDISLTVWYHEVTEIAGKSLIAVFIIFLELTWSHIRLFFKKIIEIADVFKPKSNASI